MDFKEVDRQVAEERQIYKGKYKAGGESGQIMEVGMWEVRVFAGINQERLEL